MLICELCGKEIYAVDKCTTDEIEVDGQIYKRVRYGERAGDEKLGNWCRECGVKKGTFHHANCRLAAIYMVTEKGESDNGREGRREEGRDSRNQGMVSE